MKAWQVRPGHGIAGLQQIDTDAREPGPAEVLVSMRAASLNYRDWMAARGDYPGIDGTPRIALSDGAGEVVAVGARVTRFKPGDRVINTYFPNWIDGEIALWKIAESPGATFDGVLAEQFVADESTLAAIPAHLSFEEAATISCAGITAWNALFANAVVKPGATALLLGTGGVSIWALQLAKAAGLRTIITSSSDEKLARARQLGADATINYRAVPEWQHEVLRLTGGAGADVVVEVGGYDTMARSIAATRLGGVVSITGLLSGFAGVDFGLRSLFDVAKHLHGVIVGSRSVLDEVVRLVDVQQICPVVDRVFGFDEVPAAYDYLQSGRHFGEVVVRVGG